MPESLVALAIGFGSLGLVLPAFVARGVRRAEMQLRAAFGERSYPRSDVEPSAYRVRLTRLLGGWAMLFGLVASGPSSIHLWVGIGIYAVAFVAGLGYLVFPSRERPTEAGTVR